MTILIMKNKFKHKHKNNYKYKNININPSHKNMLTRTLALKIEQIACPTCFFIGRAT